MQPHDNPRLAAFGPRGGLIQRALIAVVAISLAVIATIFLTVALIAGAFIALAIGVRWWWALRKLRQQAKATAALEGEYTVVERADTLHHLER
jgi:hypothetical protein